MHVRVAFRNKRQRKDEGGSEDMALEGDGPRLREALGGESSEDEDAD